MTALRAFLAVAEELHFGRAAARLHSSPPTVSQHVKRLEKQLGFRLLDRSSRRVELTLRGRELIELARRSVTAHDDIADWRRRARSGDRGLLRIGFWSSAAGPPSTAIFYAAIHDLGDIDVQLRHLGWAEVGPAVLDGTVDVGFMHEPIPAEGLRSRPVWSEHRVLVVRGDHPLAGRSTVSIEETAAETFIAPAEGTTDQTRFWLVDPRPDGSQPKTGAYAYDLDEIFELVAAGAGVNITGASAGTASGRDDLAFIPISDIPPTRIVLVAREKSIDPLVAKFERVVDRIAQELP